MFSKAKVRSTLLPNAIILAILSQLNVAVNYKPIICQMFVRPEEKVDIYVAKSEVTRGRRREVSPLQCGTQYSFARYSVLRSSLPKSTML
ncbi:hypothetical protein KIN20_014605 [Parelaphostrongylus tenuis]|uniref:Secreted protein n=1 Tax=Parelaphostrongylus tenuis TaxID=148309 RepID=A0AAD5MDW6_PARTN|nr:hypothetical protein KIN20_014605 [Parelaphostrongylus tenuis]